MKPLGTLDYHKKSCQALAFARSYSVDSGHALHSEDMRGSKGQGEDEAEDSEDEMSTEEKNERGRWLAVGSQDCRISIWPLISFGKS